MTERRTPIKPIRKGKTDADSYARRARAMADRLAREGYRFDDSTKIVRADRESR